MIHRPLAVVALALAVAGCPTDDETPPVGSGIFLAGCPEEGAARALVLEDPAMRMEGTDVLGGPGDVLLMNEAAAFIVQGTGPAKTWFSYGGNLIDAVVVNGCEQAGPEQFGELSFQVGVLDILDFPQSIFRGFRATSVEILSDGSGGGPARVTIHGVDDTFWVIEHQLIRQAAVEGEGKRLSESLNLELALDYTLEPGSSVLRIDFRATNLGEETIEIGLGAVVFPSDLTPRLAYNDGALRVGGRSLPIGVPWISWSSGDAAYSFGAEDANLGTTSISGANIIIDSRQLGLPLTLSPGGVTSDLRTYYVAAGAGSYNSAARGLDAVLPTPLPRRSRSPTPVLGRVTDLSLGETLSGADVFFQMRNNDDDWVSYDATRTGPDGTFSAELALFEGSGERVRMFARAPGRDDGDPVEIDLPTDEPVGLTVRGAGEITIAATDDTGTGMPIKVVFIRDGDGARFPRYAPPAGATRPIPPGTYAWTATRGFEYGVLTGAVEVPESGEASLELSLTRIVDTTGWVAIDTHVHSGPSEDSDIPAELRALTAAAEGIEMFVASDHEIVTDLQPFVDRAGVADFIDPVIGEELTATSPEHLTAYAMDVADLPRGGPIGWFGLDLDEIFTAALERAAGVGLNHPRGGASWMSLIDWDRITGEPSDRDPELLGMPAGAALWSWNFDFVEYMNGPRTPFLDPARPRDTGQFDDWQAFLNHGHRITAVGSSDIHGLENTGSSRTYIAVPTDAPGALDDLDLATALAEGRAVTSTGAFARATVDGAGPGETVVATGGEVALDVLIEALPEIDVDWFLVTYNCDEVARVTTTDPDGIIKFDGRVTVPAAEDGHIAVMGFGDGRHPEGLRNFNPEGVPRFTTNAIYVDADSDGDWTPPGGKTCTYTIEAP